MVDVFRLFVVIDIVGEVLISVGNDDFVGGFYF